MIRVLLAALLVIVLGVVSPAAAQVIPGVTTSGANDASAGASDAPAPAPSPNDIREFLRLLSDPSMQAWLRDSATGVPATGTPEAQTRSPREMFQQGVDRVRDRAAQLVAALASLPELPEVLAEQWANGLSTDQKVRGVTLLTIFIIVGAGLEWLYRQTIRLWLLRLEQAPTSGLADLVLTALQRAALIFAGLAIFAVGSIGTFAAFDWPPLIRAVILDLLVLLLIFRIVATLSLFFLAPFAPMLRLVPWTTAMARSMHATVLTVTGLTLLGFAILYFLDRLREFDTAGHALSQPLFAVQVIIGAFLLLVALGTIAWVCWRTRHFVDMTPERARAWRTWQVFLSVLAVLVFAAWVLGLQGLVYALLVFGPLPLILRGVRVWTDHFFDQSTRALQDSHEQAFERHLAEFRERVQKIEDEEERAAQVEPEIVPLPDPYPVARPIVQRFLRLVLVISALVLFTWLWGLPIRGFEASQSVPGRVLGVLFDSIVVILLADLVWTWARTVIDRRLDSYVPPEGSEAPGPEARMITLLPLFRTSILVILLTMVGLSILTSLGINIAPLLAGAGILGIAIGFGTQSLVRDIVSGLFFLIDDAFRVGEYIEVGDLMGTVESISIRSMRIRHHRGKVHTVPYGELKSVTNHSRDWVIMKLEFRVPFDTDLQLVKKLVKKVGAELKENDFYGPSILSTLKSQGVRRMEEFNMVVGVKFMTKPGEQWLVRRDAYQKVRDAFEANGIRLAERNVKVEIDRDPTKLTEEERSAIAAAAQQAAEGPTGPPKPVPDEP